MSGEIITIIVPALVAAVATPIGAWVGSRLMRAKYQAEVEQLRAEMKDKLAEVKSHELENVRKASDILMESIVPPLRAEINNLRNDVQRLNTVLELIWGCPHIDNCPVKRGLLLPPAEVRQPKGGMQECRSGAVAEWRSDGEPERERARDDPDEPDGAAGGDGDGG